MVQLKVAKEVGFKIPKTIVANNSNHIDVLNDSMIIKSLDTAIFNLGDSEAFVYTNSVDKVELEKAKISIAPIIIQDNLTPKIDYRITVIDNKVFSVKILINDKGVTGDWRKEKDNVNFVPVNLPDKINQMCCELVKNLGLSFGAIDLVCSEDTFYFIEVNPTGEWAWLVDSANQKIYEAICDSLIGNTHD
jgi:glutathione synthase/RimK-type ligase-like ATP-grasp enzyme